MKNMSFSELKSRASDRFSYILVSCPDWHPMLKNISTAKVFDGLIDLLNAISEHLKDDDARQWLTICLQEVRQSFEYYDSGKLKEGRKTIQQAERHFNDALSKKPIRPRFIAGESGSALDDETGFPS